MMNAELLAKGLVAVVFSFLRSLGHMKVEPRGVTPHLPSQRQWAQVKVTWAGAVHHKRWGQPSDPILGNGPFVLQNPPPLEPRVHSPQDPATPSISCHCHIEHIEGVHDIDKGQREAGDPSKVTRLQSWGWNPVSVWGALLTGEQLSSGAGELHSFQCHGPCELRVAHSPIVFSHGLHCTLTVAWAPCSVLE